MAWIEQRDRVSGTVWRVVWRDRDGKQQQSFGTEDEAEFFKQAVEKGGTDHWPARYIRGKGWLDEIESAAPLLRDYARLTIDARLQADPRTRADYLGMLANHINPVIGDRPIDQVTRFDVAAVGSRAIAAGKSAKTVANIHGLLSSVLSDAVEDDYLRRNVARGAMPGVPDIKTEEMTFLSPAEAAHLVKYIPEGVHRDLVRLLLGTGLRWSEATALQVGDVDLLGQKALHVRRAWKYRDGHFILGEPKTRRSRRTVSLSSELVRLLTPYAAQLDSSAFLFTTPEGRPVRHSNFYNRIWGPAVFAAQNCDAHRPDAVEALRLYRLEVRSAKRAGRGPRLSMPTPCGCPGTLPNAPRIHDCRHTHASWLLADRVSLVAIQRRLGHESIQTTIDRYSHLAPEHVEEINACIDRALAFAV